MRMGAPCPPTPNEVRAPTANSPNQALAPRRQLPRLPTQTPQLLVGCSRGFPRKIPSSSSAAPAASNEQIPSSWSAAPAAYSEKSLSSSWPAAPAASTPGRLLPRHQAKHPELLVGCARGFQRKIPTPGRLLPRHQAKNPEVLLVGCSRGIKRKIPNSWSANSPNMFELSQ